MKKMNKVITAMIIMAITTVMPAMAGNKKYGHNNKKTTVVVVTNHKNASRFDKMDKRTAHFDAHKKHAYRPVVKTCTFRVSRHAARHNVVARAERIHGVMNAYWNPRTREMTVCYDACITSARHIMHAVA